MAMCMGIAMTLTPLTWIHRVGLGQISPSGRCLSFDQSATGWTKCEGGCAFAVDNLTEKVEGISIIDDSRYYLGTVGTVKINHAGMQTSLGTPHGPAVQLLVAEACRQAHVSPCSLDGVECMADGQMMNDAVEVASLRKVACSEERVPLMLSAMKSNYGNAIQGSSLASMTKALYCQAYGYQQPSIHLVAVNPQIDDFMEGSMFMNQDIVPHSTKSSLYAAMSIGWGGTMGCGICSCGVDPARVRPVETCYPFKPMVFWPGGGGEEFPEPPNGYYISGSWTAWEEPQRMTRESAGCWTFIVTLGVNRFEEFQIHYDGDANLALHPGVSAGTNGSAAEGPNSGAFGLHWLVDGRVKLAVLQDDQEAPKLEDAKATAERSLDLLAKGKVESTMDSTSGMGDRYLVTLNIAGKWRAVSWERISSPEQVSSAGVLQTMASDSNIEGTYYITGSFNAWGFDELEKGDAPGHYKKEVRLVRGSYNFQIVRNKDRRQVFHPAYHGSTMGGGALGPDSSGQEFVWDLGGKAGDVFLIEFHRALEGGLDNKTVSFRFLREEPPSDDEVLLMKRPRYCIVGSWDGFQRSKEMTWNGVGYEHYVQVGPVGYESFQILHNGSWFECLYPSVANANTHEEHQIHYGIAPGFAGGEELVWSIGAHETEEGSAGVRYEVMLAVDRRGNPTNVSWKRLA
uniref:Ketosynthase family 3 (KS3) domain-containing protein n=1 Tax=Alexandrium catenella TaxID=2925 RepID=A0A7S1SCT2_ALECA